MTRPVRAAAQNIRHALTDAQPDPGPEAVRVAGWWVFGANDEDLRWIDAADLETVLRGTASP